MNKHEIKQALHLSRWLDSQASSYAGTVFDEQFEQYVSPGKEVSLAASLLATVQTDNLEQAQSRAVAMIEARIDFGMQFPQQFWNLACRLVGKPDLLKGKKPLGILAKPESLIPEWGGDWVEVEE